MMLALAGLVDCTWNFSEVAAGPAGTVLIDILIRTVAFARVVVNGLDPPPPGVEAPETETTLPAQPAPNVGPVMA